MAKKFKIIYFTLDTLDIALETTAEYDDDSKTEENAKRFAKSMIPNLGFDIDNTGFCVGLIDE